MNEPAFPSPKIIGTLAEKTIHRQLKERYATENRGLTEQSIAGFVVDVLAADKIIEIQTGSFLSLKKKLDRLLQDYKIRLVHPLAAEKTLIVLEADGLTLQSRRKSPKRQGHAHAAGQLLYITEFLGHPNFEFESLLIIQEETRIDDGNGSWRRKGKSLGDSRMIQLMEKKLYKSPGDYLSLLPAGLPEEFTSQDLAKKLPGGKKTAGQVCYLLRKLSLLEVTGKQGACILYKKSPGLALHSRNKE